MPTKHTADQWSAETKLATIIETASMSEAQLSEYCRSKGIYPEQITQWKINCISGFATSQEQTQKIKQQSKQDKTKIKSLEKELSRKEKALAETAALLVLRKKFNALYGDEAEGQ